MSDRFNNIFWGVMLVTTFATVLFAAGNCMELL